MPYSTDIKDYYRRAWGLEDRPKFKHGGSWADWMTNFSDQMTFEEYLRMDLKTKKPHALDEKADGGRIGLKPGGIVEPGVTHYATKTNPYYQKVKKKDYSSRALRNPARTEADIKADAFRTGVPRIKISDWTSEQRANLKTWMKNTGSTLEDYHKNISKDKRFNIKHGILTGILQAEEPKKQANIKAWEKNTGLKFKDVKDPAKKWNIRGGYITGVQGSQIAKEKKAANIKAWEKYTGLKYKDLDKERQSGVRLGKLKGTKELSLISQSLEKSIWLKDYTFADLTKDLKAGKTHAQIADKLYEKNPEFFENLQKTRKVKDPNPINSLRTALWGRIGKKDDLIRLNKLNEKNFLTREKAALQDVRNFIKKNQDAYKKVYASNKIGAVSNFREKVLDFISKKYPEFITRAKGGQKILSGQRIFTPYRLTERKGGQGIYSLDVGLKKDIRKALDIPERSAAGEGMTIPRLQRSYNKNLLSLIKIARDKNIIPKSINSESKYVSYVKKTQTDPIRNLFGKKFNFGQEHLGGVARAVVVNDAQALAKVTAMDPDVNRWVKSPQYDKRISNLMKLAKQSSGETAKGYIDSMNKLLAESDKKFGLNQTKYKIVKDEIIPIQPKASLEDSLYKKAQRALKTFVATKRFKDPNFKLLPEELKKAINFLKGGDILKSNAFLKAAIRSAPRILSKFALAEGTILDDVLKKQAEGKSALESFGSALFLDKPIRKGLKRWKADDQQNLAYDRANLLRFVEEGKAGISSIISMAMKDPDFKGRPGEYMEWLKMVVADPHQQRLIRERDIQTEEALTLPAEKVAKRKKQYEAWKSIPVVQAVEEYITPDKQKEKEWLNRGGLTGVDQYIINRGI